MSDDLREKVIAALRGTRCIATPRMERGYAKPIPEEAALMADAVLAVVDPDGLRAEVERLAAGWDASDAVAIQGTVLVNALAAERDAAVREVRFAQDRYITMSFRRDALEGFLRDLPDRMPIETLHGADGAAVWLREEIRALLSTPEPTP